MKLRVHTNDINYFKKCQDCVHASQMESIGEAIATNPGNWQFEQRFSVRGPFVCHSQMDTVAFTFFLTFTFLSLIYSVLFHTHTHTQLCF